MEALRDVQRRDSRVVVIELAANFGQHAAFSAGFDRAQGQYLVTMDADLQCDPADIPALIAPLKQGYDLVSGIRRESTRSMGAAHVFARAGADDQGDDRRPRCATSAVRSTPARRKWRQRCRRSASSAGS